MLATAMTANDQAFDLNGDGIVDIADRKFWIEELANSYFGDSNFDGTFGSSDFVAVFAIGKYETGDPATWAEGDWDGDQLFTTGDFVTAFQGSGYEQGPREGGLQTVPEPSMSGMLLIAIGIMIARFRPSFRLR